MHERRAPSPTTCGQMTRSPSARGIPAGSCSRPSSGNESTSVASSIPRCSRLSARLSSGGTNARPKLALLDPLGREHAPRSSTAPASSTAAPLRFSTSTATTRTYRLRAVPVSSAWSLYASTIRCELVPDDVLVRELDEADPVDRAEDVAHLDQAGGLVARQVDLGDVAGDDDLGAEAEPRQEHLHLQRGEVFCASSRMMNESFSVRPRMKASGATSTVPRSM